MTRRTVITLLLIALVPALASAQKGGGAWPKPDSTRELTPGVTYSHTYIPKSRLSVHALVVDLSNPFLGVRVGKGLDHISGLERVHSIAHRFDSALTAVRVLAGVNANFWKAGTLHPMGPTVSDGELLTADKYRNWPSLAITEDGGMYIDTFHIDVRIRTRVGSIPISRLNRRTDSTEIVLYTTYFGNSVPFIDTLGIREASRDVVTDETEAAIDTMILALMDSVWSVSPESGTLKLQFEYLGTPRVNTPVQCRITAMDTGFVAIPENGGVISFGKGQFPLFYSLMVGDRFALSSVCDPPIPGPVVEMTGGVPRIVRDGKPSIEWVEAGLKKQRFVTGHYGRSSVGISQGGDSLILITVEPYNRKQRRRGASLQTMAELQLAYGAWQALNFDGGSSATMMIEDVTRVPLTGNRRSRKISTALLIYERLGKTAESDLQRVKKILRRK
ncbi:MAG: phosphodiester glycosidase family protein [Bacteroidia bacterium]|nr:phosphodiester glycosidase family protein [Bacteroidia bacterium]